VKPILKITEATGNSWDFELATNALYTIGRAKENDIVLNDRRVSRHHAQVAAENGNFKIIDGYFADGEFKRSVNRVFVNGIPHLDKILEPGDMVMIGESRLIFQTIADVPQVEPETTDQKTSTGVNFDDQPLGHTQLLISAREIIGKHSNLSLEAEMISPAEIKELRRKAQILEMLYDMSKTLGTIFDLKEIFMRATDLIFSVTPSDRVVALLADETLDGKILDYSLFPIAVKRAMKIWKKLPKN
jgi:pSer/pThr/pTyr-binding forkhead associated (FHA) protein